MGNILELISAGAEASKACSNRNLHFIFQRASVFLTNREIINLLCLNKCFHMHFPNDQVLRSLILNLLSTLLQIPVDTDSAIEFFKTHTGIAINTIYDLARVCRKPKNLLKNPYGAGGYSHWDKVDGGDGWRIENFLTFNNNRSCFVSSYKWCCLSTSINLRPFISSNSDDRTMKLFVGSPVSRRFDCGGIAKLVVAVEKLGGNNEMVQQIFVPSWIKRSNINISCPWELLSTVIDIEPTAQRAILKFMGRDEKYWAGNYGARFGYLFAIILYD